MHIIVIGGGIGGMAAAAELAVDGHSVTLLEKNANLGGKLNQIKADGFRFDTGPSLLTMPHLLDELFDRAGLPESDRPEYLPLNPGCRYFWQNGTRFDASSDLSATLAEIRRIAPEDETGYVRFLGHSADLYAKTAETFLFNPLRGWSDLKSLKLSDVFRINATKTVSGVVDRYVESPYLRQFFKRFTTYNGSSPYHAPATLNVIPFVEVAQGGWYVKGGMYRIAEALETLLRKHEVTIRTECDVDEILTEDKAATGVKTTDGRTFRADAVIANSDAHETYTQLLSKDVVSASVRKKQNRIEPSCSGFVLLLGTDRKWDQLHHHNIFFSDDYRREFEDIFNRKELPGDPTIYIADTSFTDPDHAIPGGSNLFVLINAPYITGKPDPDKSEAYANDVIRMLEQRGLDDLNKHIRYKQIIDPHAFYDWFRSKRGSIYGTSSNSKMAAFMRPRNRSPYIENLYLCGGSTHPGGGIPLVLLSARHAVRAFREDGDW